MLQLGAIGFLQPWILAALAGLPLLWWLLRVTPPAPRRQHFPALRLLLGLTPPEETPARTPWWLLLLRLLAISLIIVGLAQPLLNPSARLGGSGPLVLVVDDGWAAARNWSQREAAAQSLLDQAGREKRPVILMTTAPSELAEPMAPSGHLTAAEARRRLLGLTPKPWPSDRSAARAALEGLQVPPTTEIVWLSDGLQDAAGEALAETLADLGRLTVMRDAGSVLPHLVLPPENLASGMSVGVRRASPRGEGLATVTALGEDGGLIGRSLATFADGELVAKASIELPIELRNRIARLVIEGESQAGAVLLLDERWRRRPVGIITSAAQEQRQPLLSEVHYLDRALQPFTELRRGEVGDLLKRDLAVLIQPDSSQISDQDRAAIADWVDRGGLLLRFAGPQLAETGGDEQLPVLLRGGGRILGGVMTWDSPAELAPFERSSPFDGLILPRDVRIRSQVLAEPTLDLADKTWARLDDGTPLVTADPRGDGWVVLIHTTANTLWSDLALSGLYVDLLRRIVAVSQGIQGESQGELALPPLQILDGFGRLTAPPPTVLAAGPAVFDDALIGPHNPPGYYGGLGQQRALNLIDAGPTLEPLDRVPSGASLASYAKTAEADLKPWFLLAAVILLLLDLMIALGYRGLIRRARSHGAAALLLLALLPMPEAWAQNDDGFAMDATLETRLAYVRTGDPAVDQASEAGLTGLSRVLQRRTSVEAGTPMGVDLERDELSFFPLLYWPVTTTQPTLSQAARDKVNRYLGHGGTILFDQRQPGAGIQFLGQASDQSQALQRLAEGLDIPPLAPVPPDHVITKSFYLMQDFPGRYSGGTLWIGATEGRVNDGVTAVLIGSNDWASAWAVNELGRPIYAVVPGGERQRELAYRVGVNLVMYALTGNYKADQVHIPFILERLGQ